MIRKIILAILGVALIVGSVFVARMLSESKKAPKPREQKQVTSIFTQTVNNGSLPIVVKASGNLMAKKRIELFAEVQGLFENTGRSFLPGEQYRRGATLIKINSKEHRANIRSQKANLHNQVVNFLPDLRLDYPESFSQWQQYIRDFDINAPLQAFPEPATEREKLFIAGRNIQTAYYNIKNLEERLEKYTIRAPYSGILTETLVDKGAVVRAGQKLGEFISPTVYELEVAVNEGYADLLAEGKKVNLFNIDRTKNWIGTVKRINARVDPASQTVQVFIQVSGSDLREGMYLEADVTAREEANTFEVDRKLLFDENKLFLYRDSTLDMVEVEPVYFKENSVVVRGLSDGDEILSKPIPGAFAGMKVSVFEKAN